LDHPKAKFQHLLFSRLSEIFHIGIAPDSKIMSPIIKKRKLESESQPAQLDGASMNDSRSAEDGKALGITAPAGLDTLNWAKKAKEQDVSAAYAGDAYKSSLFKLQVDEMLREVKLDYTKRMGPVDNALRKLKSLIEGIADREPLPVSRTFRS
jgi:U3 small nucleolar RNA-associated protein 22